MPSVDNLEFVMESLALGHTVLDQKTVSGGIQQALIKQVLVHVLGAPG